MGCFAIGLIAGSIGRLPHASPSRLITITGFLGGFTTFSTFAHDSVALWERGARALAVTNAVGSVIAGCAAVVLGIALSQTTFGPPAD